MRFSASTSPSTVGVMLLVLIPAAIALNGPAHPQLRHEGRGTIEKRTLFGSMSSPFNKRDDCGTQFGPTYVDCGRLGCYQPSLGEICCAAEETYCLEGTFCLGNGCCPNGLTASCCDLGKGCPANVSDYYTTASWTATSAASTSLPVSISTSVTASATSTKISTSPAAVSSTSSSSASSALATPKSTSSVALKSASGVSTTGTSSVVSSTSSARASTTVAPASAAKGKTLEMGLDTVAVVVLCVVGFAAGLM